MTFSQRALKPMLLGGASVAALTLAVLVGQNTNWRESRVEAPRSIDAPAPAPEALAEEERTEIAQEAPSMDGLLSKFDSGLYRGDVDRDAAEITPNQPADSRAAGADGYAQGLANSNDQPLSELATGARNRQGRAKQAAEGQLALGGEADARRVLVPAAPLDDASPWAVREQGRDRFEEIEINPLKVTAEAPVSTFSIDVDTASYSFMRKALMNGVLPQRDAIRIEELINYFPYDYAAPDGAETPFRANVAVTETPWNADTLLMRVGVRGYALQQQEKPRSNLVFLLDTSGSMNEPDKLPLLINSFRLLVDSLDDDDTISIVAYAGSAGTVLEPTKVSEKAKILASLERLHAGGSTAGGEGVRQAYQLAEASFDEDGVNRVILATDGDFNVGITDQDELQSFIERKRESGVFLSVLGFGRGNYNDALMQALAQNGNGQAAYIDTLSEARKVLVEEAGSTLFPIAKDVKIQIEFNPSAVAEYRLIGYETRLLRREDFNNDAIDAGEIGSGHTVTALYELTPTGSDALLVDNLRYQPAAAAPGAADELAFVKIRYKQPDADQSQLITRPVAADERVGAQSTDARELRFAAAVAGFGQLLRGGRYTGEWGYDDAIALAEGAKGPDRFGYRAEFVQLARLAKSAAALEPQR